MEYGELLKNRRAIRDFQDRQVPLPLIKEMLQETTLAPTASNVQPCRFIIVQDRALMQRLSDDSKKNLLEDFQHTTNERLKMYAGVLADPNFNVFYNAPCLVLILGPASVNSLDVDSALTAAYFMFAAASRGLGTCWINLGADIRDRGLLETIGMPDGCRIVAPIILGYPVSLPEAPERHAPDIVKIVS